MLLLSRCRLAAEESNCQHRSRAASLEGHQRDGILKVGTGVPVDADDWREIRRLLWLLELETSEIAAADCHMALRRLLEPPPL